MVPHVIEPHFDLRQKKRRPQTEALSLWVSMSLAAGFQELVRPPHPHSHYPSTALPNSFDSSNHIFPLTRQHSIRLALVLHSCHTHTRTRTAPQSPSHLLLLLLQPPPSL